MKEKVDTEEFINLVLAYTEFSPCLIQHIEDGEYQEGCEDAALLEGVIMKVPTSRHIGITHDTFLARQKERRST